MRSILITFAAFLLPIILLGCGDKDNEFHNAYFSISNQEEQPVLEAVTVTISQDGTLLEELDLTAPAENPDTGGTLWLGTEISVKIPYGILTTVIATDGDNYDGFECLFEEGAPVDFISASYDLDGNLVIKPRHTSGSCYQYLNDADTGS